MAKAKTLIKGNYAIAEAAIRAGCTFFAVYPITPQSEIPEYMSSRMPEIGGVFVQTESEIAGISMIYGAAACGRRAMTSSSGPGFSLMQEGISYMASAQVPCVIVDVTRYGCGLGDINPAQGDYLQLAKNGGHGDYRCVVLTPGSLQECVDFMPLAFEIAEKYRNPVIVAPDGSIGQMVESVDFPDDITKHDIDKYDWTIHHTRGEKHKTFCPDFYYDITLDESVELVKAKIDAMEKNEARAEEFMTEDAELVLVSYGTTSRIVKEAVTEARKQGIKLGLIRPKTIWPFPKFAFKNCRPKGFLAVEQCVMPQLAEDVALAARKIAPTYSYTTGAGYPRVSNIIDIAEKALAGELKEV